MDVERLYRDLADEHGAGTLKGLGWSTWNAQAKRSKVIVEGLAWTGKVGSVLDVGCGTGHLMSTVGFSDWVNNYTGVDFLHSNLVQARKTARGCKYLYHASFLEGDFLDVDLSYDFDFVVASGLMSYYSLVDIGKIVEKMWSLAKVSMIFNVRIPQTIPTYNTLIWLLEDGGIDRWIARRDYGEEDVTIYAFK